MKLTVEFFVNEDTEEWYWHAKASNGEIVAFAGEGYKNKADCEKIAKKIFGDITYVTASRD